MFEAEVRFEVTDDSTVRTVLKDAKEIGDTHQLDEYYDFADLRLYRQRAFIRVRDHRKLNLKYIPADASSSVAEEVVFDCGGTDLDSLARIARHLGINVFNDTDAGEQMLKDWLLGNSLTNFLTVEKRRVTYRDGLNSYMLDEVKGLGRFMEIEREVTTRKEADRAEVELKGLAKRLGLKTIDNKGYVQLLVEKHHPELLGG